MLKALQYANQRGCDGDRLYYDGSAMSKLPTLRILQGVSHMQNVLWLSTYRFICFARRYAPEILSQNVRLS